MSEFPVVIEKGDDGYGAYSPDLPGCVALGATRGEAEQKMYEAIGFHLEGLREEGTGQRDSGEDYPQEAL